MDYSIDHAHPSSKECEEREDELNEVVGQRLKAMKPPRATMHVVGHGVRNWLGLEQCGGAHGENQTMLRSSKCVISVCEHIKDL